MNDRGNKQAQRDRTLGDRTLGDRTRGGAVATEFALTAPLLMLIALGCVDFGRVAYYATSIASAAGAGAQYGATHRATPYTQDAWEQEIQSIVAEELAAVPGFDPQLLDVQANCVDEPDGNVRVRVEAQYPFETIVDWPGLPARIDLHRPVEFRQYR